MKINKINKLSKFKNTKLLKNIKIGSCVIFIASNLSACIPEGYVNDCISDDMSFSEILYSISDKTNFDEYLEATDYKKNIDEYKIARQNKDLNQVSKSLNSLGNDILKASTGDTLINNGLIKTFNDLIDVKIDYTDVYDRWGKLHDCYFIEVSYIDSKKKIVPGNIELSNDIMKKKYLIKYETFDICYNIKTCEDNKITSLKLADDIFKSYERFILTTGDLTLDKSEFNNYNYDGVIVNFYDDNKINMLKK